MKPSSKPNRTASDREREQAIRERHEASPLRKPPSGTVDQKSFAGILSLLAKLKASRETQGLSLTETATRMGVDAPALSRLETGKVLNPTLATLNHWAEALGLQIDIDVSPKRRGR